MTNDYEEKDEIIKGRDLQPGDCVRAICWAENRDVNDTGIIMATSLHDTTRGKELKEFYGNEPAYEIYDINSPTNGPCSTRLNPEKDFNLIRSRKDILHIYKTIDYELLKESADLLKQSFNIDDVKDLAFDRINDRLKVKKK